ncbi:MAG: DUF72 domain-containing protein [Vicinamibacterales bacterium]
MIWIGTSGYNYPEWRGSFYPERFPAAKMLPFYAERFPTVEINYTFYRMPTPALLEGWLRATPGHFRITLKAPRRITHDARLRDCGDSVRQFLEVASTLGTQRGALLFQLPPYLRKDLPLLDAFLEFLPRDARATLEFRHASWFDDEVFARLRERNVALCIADSEKLSAPLEQTADFGYVRLRDEAYTPDDLSRWAERVAAWASGDRDVFVYFKHEQAGKGPEFGQALRQLLGQQT